MTVNRRDCQLLKMSKKDLEHKPADESLNKFQEEREIIDRIIAGDIELYSVLVVRYQQRLVQFLYRKYGDNGLVEDIAQNVFVRAYQRLEQFQGKSQFFTWLCTIAIRLMINALNDKSRRPDFMFETDMDDENMVSYADLHIDNSHSVEDLVLADETKREIEKLLAQVPQKLLEPLLLSTEKGMSYLEISEYLGVSLDSVRSRINRARTEFKRLLANSNISL